MYLNVIRNFDDKKIPAETGKFLTEPDYKPNSVSLSDFKAGKRR